MEEVKEYYKVVCKDLSEGTHWYKDFDENHEAAEKYAIEQMWNGIFTKIECIHVGLPDF